MAKYDPRAVILAGGKGERLESLVADRVKPAVPFGGKYRIMDFIVSNLYNSKILLVDVLTQGNTLSLQKHLEEGAMRIFGNGPHNRLSILHSNQGDLGEKFVGTADAVWQMRERFNNGYNPIMVLPGDHVCFMEMDDFGRTHYNSGAELTVCAKPVSISLAAKQYGVLVVDKSNKVIGFEEKPENPTPIPGQPEMCLASMGIYAFQKIPLLEALALDQRKIRVAKRSEVTDPNAMSTRDFGNDIIPHMLRHGHDVMAYDFSKNEVPGMENSDRDYWRDLGLPDEYFDGSMDVCSVKPPLNLYDPRWPIHTQSPSLPPAKFVHGGMHIDSVIGDGSIISGANIISSVISYNIRAHRGSHIENSIIFEGVDIGRGARIEGGIIDKNVRIPKGMTLNADVAKGLPPRVDKYWVDGKEVEVIIPVTVTPKGRFVIPKWYVFPGQEAAPRW